MRELFTIPSPPIAGAYLTESYISALYLNRILDAESDISSVEAIADGKINTYLQNSNVVGIPSPDQAMTQSTGDLWIDTYDSNPSYHKNNVFRFRYVTGTESITGYFYTGVAWDTTYRENYSVTDKYIWEDIADLGIAEAISDAADAQTDASQALLDAGAAQDTADGKITSFYQDAAPSSGMSSGDFWIDTNDGNRMYRYSGSAWVDAQDDQIGDAIQDAANASTLAGSKITTFYQSAQPTGLAVGDLWIDTDVDILYRCSVVPSTWVQVKTTIRTLYETSPPTDNDVTGGSTSSKAALTTGDLWVDISTSKQNMFRFDNSYTGNKPGYKWSGSSWGSYLDDVSSSGSACWIDIDDIKILQKATYITVSTNTNEGDYTDVSQAILALPSEGGIIYIKNGTYSEYSPMELPNKHITFIGESVDGVLLRNTGIDSRIFEPASSEPTDAFRHRFRDISFYSASSTSTTECLEFGDSATWPNDVDIRNCNIESLENYGIVMNGVGRLVVDENSYVKAKFTNIITKNKMDYVSICNSEFFIDNYYYNSLDNRICNLEVFTSNGRVENNGIVLNSSYDFSTGTFVAGIYVSTSGDLSELLISNNKISVSQLDTSLTTAGSGLYVTGVLVTNSRGVSISKNNISLVDDDTSGSYIANLHGIYLTSGTDPDDYMVSENKIYIDGQASYGGYGIYNSGLDYSTCVNNQIFGYGSAAPIYPASWDATCELSGNVSRSTL